MPSLATPSLPVEGCSLSLTHVSTPSYPAPLTHPTPRHDRCRAVRTAAAAQPPPPAPAATTPCRRPARVVVRRALTLRVPPAPPRRVRRWLCWQATTTTASAPCCRWTAYVVVAPLVVCLSLTLCVSIGQRVAESHAAAHWLRTTQHAIV